jgi:hypothetical protein
VASITLRPLSESLLINSTFVCVGIVPGSFCRPSLGPTSTMVTLRGKLLPPIPCARNVAGGGVVRPCQRAGPSVH